MNLPKYLEATVVSMFNMTVVVLLGFTIVWYGIAAARMELLPSKLPSVWRAMWDIFLCICINEVSFYYVHRSAYFLLFLSFPANFFKVKKKKRNSKILG